MTTTTSQTLWKPLRTKTSLRTTLRISYSSTTISPSIPEREKVSFYAGTSFKDEPATDPKAEDNALIDHPQSRISRKTIPMTNGPN
jgi:hypothetical protein